MCTDETAAEGMFFGRNARCLIPSFTQHVALPLTDQYLNYPRQLRIVEVVTCREAISILSLVTHPKQTHKK